MVDDKGIEAVLVLIFLLQKSLLKGKHLREVKGGL
jgi:hypothetical protein